MPVAGCRRFLPFKVTFNSCSYSCSAPTSTLTSTPTASPTDTSTPNPTYYPRACSLGPRARARERRSAGEEWWKKTNAQSNIQDEAKKTRMMVFNASMFVILTFSFVSCTTSCLLTYSYLDRSNFSKTTCSTDLHDGTPSVTNFFTSLQKMSIQVLEVVRMLLVMSGLETNPGPVSTRSTNTAPPPGFLENMILLHL